MTFKMLYIRQWKTVISERWPTNEGTLGLPKSVAWEFPDHCTLRRNTGRGCKTEAELELRIWRDQDTSSLRAGCWRGEVCQERVLSRLAEGPPQVFSHVMIRACMCRNCLSTEKEILKKIRDNITQIPCGARTSRIN